MRASQLRFGVQLLCAVLLGLNGSVACSDATDDVAATAGSGGQPSSGGAAGTGGTNWGGSGGTGTGGSNSSGGTAAIGGSGGAAGMAGAAGSSGSAGGDAGVSDATADAGSGGTSSADSGADAGPTKQVLLNVPGPVFKPTPSDLHRRFNFGLKGTTYVDIQVDFDFMVGDWQPHLPDPSNRTEHILFALARNATSSYARYLMGAAPLVYDPAFSNKSTQLRVFGRKSIGMGYQTYTSWTGSVGWQKGAVYHLSCLLDGLAQQQRCALFKAGTLVKSLGGAVVYLDPAAHLTNGFFLELGSPNPGDIEASPIGWQFSNLTVCASTLP